MRGRRPETWKVDEGAYRRWLAGRFAAFHPTLDLTHPSLKSLVALALLDAREKPISYSALRTQILEKNVLRSKNISRRVHLTVPALRVAISELGRQLNEQGHHLQVRAGRNGKEARFELVTAKATNHAKTPESEDEGMNYLKGMCQIIPGKNTPATDPIETSHALIRDGGGLPFASFYSNYRTAAQWLAYSSRLGSTKKSYEAESFFAYRLTDHLLKGEGSHTLGVLGLAPGEGLGEVELLQRLLRGDLQQRIRRVHYLAVDTSELLLTSHTCLIREHFQREIAEGRLIFAPVLGDLFQLEAQIEAARRVRGARFLEGIPVVGTYFGNCLGNHENHEWDFFRTVFTAIPRPIPIALLTGVSLLRWKNDRRGGEPVEDEYQMDSFTLETPRHLLHESNLLESLDQSGIPIPQEENTEFIVHDEKRIPSEIYSNPFGVTGRAYRFKYTLRNDIRTCDRKYLLRRGSKILLYSIVKYDLPSLIQFLEGRGLTTKGPTKDYTILTQKNGREEYRYAVIASVRE